MTLTNNDCQSLILDKYTADTLFYPTNNTRLVTKFNCCNPKTYDLLNPYSFTMGINCVSNAPVTFQLSLDGIDFNMISDITYSLDNTSGITVTENSTGLYTVVMVGVIERVLSFVITMVSGNTYTTSITLRTPNDDCGDLDYDGTKLTPSCGFDFNSVSQIEFNSAGFTGLNCAEPDNLETGVYTVYLQNVDNNGNVIDQECSSIFIDCNTLQCYILRLYKDTPETTIVALRHYLALTQASTLLNTPALSESCSTYLSCEDLCELYKLVLTESQSIASNINYTPYNTSDCGCNG